ncbi:MAG TPA: VTT domain-containing protein [Candidatus Paceibacterota bacterium]|jgi:uncharacterized membrane protein YdjX (TVP38/TMEM64 family)|nr:VTT domain-containing protein [Bacillota bacterium]HOE15720.1 VTT domain-containing protein [Candidatus Paceibacterota bacterium]
MKKKELRNKILKGILVLVVYVAIGLVLYLVTKIFNLDIDKIKELIQNNQNLSYLIFLIAQIIMSLLLILLPGTTMSFIVLGLSIFTPFEAFVLVSFGTFIVSIIFYIIGRYLGNRVVIKIIGQETFDKYDAIFQRRMSLFYPIAMLLPFFPDDELTIIAGTAKVKWSYFLITTLICRSVGIGVLCFLGGSIPWRTLPVEQIVFLILLLLFAAFELFVFAFQLDKYYAKRGSIKK